VRRGQGADHRTAGRRCRDLASHPLAALDGHCVSNHFRNLATCSGVGGRRPGCARRRSAIKSRCATNRAKRRRRRANEPAESPFPLAPGGSLSKSAVHRSGPIPESLSRLGCLFLNILARLRRHPNHNVTTRLMPFVVRCCALTCAGVLTSYPEDDKEVNFQSDLSQLSYQRSKPISGLGTSRPGTVKARPACTVRQVPARRSTLGGSAWVGAPSTCRSAWRRSTDRASGCP
jgi:hypothetical protein